jgi:hypothetical protein
LRPGVIPIPYRKFFWELHISLKPFCQSYPNFAQMFLGWSSSKVMFGMSGIQRRAQEGAYNLFFVLWNLMISWIVFILHRKIFPIHHTCMTCLFFSFLIIYKTRPNDFDLQLGCCISDAFSIFSLCFEILTWFSKFGITMMRYRSSLAFVPTE